MTIEPNLQARIAAKRQELKDSGALILSSDIQTRANSAFLNAVMVMYRDGAVWSERLTLEDGEYSPDLEWKRADFSYSAARSKFRELTEEGREGGDRISRKRLWELRIEAFRNYLAHYPGSNIVMMLSDVTEEERRIFEETPAAVEKLKKISLRRWTCLMADEDPEVRQVAQALFSMAKQQQESPRPALASRRR